MIKRIYIPCLILRFLINEIKQNFFFSRESENTASLFFFLDKYKYLAIKTKTISFLIQDLLSQKEYT